jgi:hypothetical protein
MQLNLDKESQEPWSKILLIHTYVLNKYGTLLQIYNHKFKQQIIFC